MRSLNPDQALKHGAARVKISCLCSIQQRKVVGFLPAGDRAHWRQIHYFFFLKGAKAQVLCSQPLTLDFSKGTAAWPGVTHGESGVGSTGERTEEVFVRISGLGNKSKPQQQPL